MVVKKKDLLNGFTKLLPEGLDESTIQKLAETVASIIEEETKTATQDLARKATSFIRAQVDKLKEQAVKELELENETFRNAQTYETLRSMMALEVTGKDQDNKLESLVKVSESQDQKINVLAKELERVLKENVKITKQLKVVTDRNELLEESLEELNESIETSEKSQTKSHMSDRAIVVSAQNFKVVETKEKEKDKVQSKIRESRNEWLTEELVKAFEKIESLKG